MIASMNIHHVTRITGQVQERNSHRWAILSLEFADGSHVSLVFHPAEGVTPEDLLEQITPAEAA